MNRMMQWAIAAALLGTGGLAAAAPARVGSPKTATTIFRSSLRSETARSTSNLNRSGAHLMSRAKRVGASNRFTAITKGNTISNHTLMATNGGFSFRPGATVPTGTKLTIKGVRGAGPGRQTNYSSIVAK